MRKHQLTYLLAAALLAALGLHAADDVVLADFEGETYGSWRTTGEAFGPGPARGTLPGQMEVSGFRDKGLVNSFHRGDDSTGTLTSPQFNHSLSRIILDFLDLHHERPVMQMLIRYDLDTAAAVTMKDTV